MRIAVISDIHGNQTALEAVLADLRLSAPDLILHGGDLADAGASPAQVVDRIRDLGWQGAAGNTDEMLCRPESLEEFAGQSSAPASLWAAIREMAAATREALGQERIAWLRELPRLKIQNPVALVHALPETTWRAPGREAADHELESAYGSLRQPVVIYGHIHQPYIRKLPGMTVANSGSVSLSYDGDCRASYILVDDSKPGIRRVDYDLNRELRALASSRLPHADWIARILETGRPQLP